MLNNIAIPKDAMWKDIRAPTTKQHILYNYIQERAKAENLSSIETNQLYICIYIGLLIGTITNNDIELYDSKITKIHNITKTPTGYVTDRSINPRPIKIEKISKHGQTRSSDMWAKFYKTYMKYT